MCNYTRAEQGEIYQFLSSRILVRILLLQNGHNTHDCLSIEPPLILLRNLISALTTIKNIVYLL